MGSPTTVFVTAFLKLPGDRSADKSVETFVAHFLRLASTGIPLHLFLSSCFLPLLPAMSNVHITPLELHELQAYQELQGLDYTVPITNAPHHDTEPFMIVMNSKVEFVHRAMKDSRWKEVPQFAWIDFGICHVLRNWEQSSQQLQLMAHTRYKSSAVYLPGCWDLTMGRPTLFSAVNWRFCGGFFLGDRASLNHFYDLSRANWVNVIKEQKRLVWEVNIWHWLELEKGWEPVWFRGDHNDSILQIPRSYIYTVASLTTIPSRLQTETREAVASLLSQVDHVYLSVPTTYNRFGPCDELPVWLREDPFKGRVSVCRGEDFGPATKYLGALSQIRDGAWILVCDDDQEYAPNLVERMMESVNRLAIYQNHYHSIKGKTSGGLVHGYVGNLIPKALLANLLQFDRPPSAHFVDDQWMSIYAFLHGIPILPTPLEHYPQIFKVLQNGWHEKIGSESLAALRNRDEKIRELEAHFQVRFAAKEPWRVERVLEGWRFL